MITQQVGSFISDDCQFTHGDNIYLDYGVIIGAKGLGYTREKDHTLKEKSATFGVTIGDNVFIGANTVVVRGSWRDTVIGDGCKIANSCTIGHNVILGKNVLIGPGVIICGSCNIGDNVNIWSNAVISNHVTVPAGVSINGLRLVLRSDFYEQNP